MSTVDEAPRPFSGEIVGCTEINSGTTIFNVKGNYYEGNSPKDFTLKIKGQHPQLVPPNRIKTEILYSDRKDRYDISHYELSNPDGETFLKYNKQTLLQRILD